MSLLSSLSNFCHWCFEFNFDDTLLVKFYQLVLYLSTEIFFSQFP